jgi:hypothetical protein
MMNNKNNKNTLLQSVAYGPHAASMALRLKASFHASPAAIMALLAKHRLHQSKNLALRAEKPLTSPIALPHSHSENLPKGKTVESRLRFFLRYAMKASLRAERGLRLKMFFSEAMFLLLDVCNNDSYVIRAVAWA